MGHTASDKVVMNIIRCRKQLTEEDKHKVAGELSNDLQGDDFWLATCVWSSRIQTSIVRQTHHASMHTYLSSCRAGR